MKDIFSQAGAHARKTDPHTSHEAARSIGDRKLRQAHRRIVRALKRLGPGTDDELYRRLTVLDSFPISPSGCRTRRSELVVMGLVCDSGERVRLKSGRKAIVWKKA